MGEMGKDAHLAPRSSQAIVGAACGRPTGGEI
jgi:hypothetical protein